MELTTYYHSRNRDTVSSLGGLDAPGWLIFAKTYHTTNLTSTTYSPISISVKDLPFASTVSMVRHFRQALALDERRVKFLPEYRRHPYIHPPMLLPPIIGSHKEVWFLGAHSDVGGSNHNDDQPALSNVPFRWMLWEAVMHDLRLGPISLLRMPAIMNVPAVRKYLEQNLPQALSTWLVPNGVLPYDVTPDLMSKIRRDFQPVHRCRIVQLAANHDTASDIIRPDANQTDDRAQGKTESLKGLGYRALEYWPFTWTWYESRADAWVPVTRPA